MAKEKINMATRARGGDASSDEDGIVHRLGVEEGLKEHSYSFIVVK